MVQQRARPARLQAGGGVPHFGEIADAYVLQVPPRHHLEGGLPARLHLHAFNQARRLLQTQGGQPLAQGLLAVNRVPVLQGLQRGDFVLVLLVIPAQFPHLGIDERQFAPKLLQAVLSAALLVPLFPQKVRELGLGSRQLVQLAFQPLQVQTLRLLAQFAAALFKVVQSGLDGLQARAIPLDLPVGIGEGLVQGVPFMLPPLHGPLSLAQGLVRRVASLLRAF